MILRFGKSMAVSYYPGYVAGLGSRGLLLLFVNVEILSDYFDPSRSKSVF